MLLDGSRVSHFERILDRYLDLLLLATFNDLGNLRLQLINLLPRIPLGFFRRGLQPEIVDLRMPFLRAIQWSRKAFHSASFATAFDSSSSEASSFWDAFSSASAEKLFSLGTAYSDFFFAVIRRIW